jgi:hypothetical protein
MDKKIRIELPDEWVYVSVHDVGGPWAARWDHPEAAGALQVSAAEYEGGPEPRPSKARLIEMAISFGQENKFGRLIDSYGGKCVIGAFGSAVFRRAPFWRFSVPSYSHVWFLSNGLDFIFVTFFAKRKPSEQEVGDAQRIVKRMDFC